MYSKIVVAVDGSEAAARAFDAALQLACKAGASLHPLFVIACPRIGPH